MNLFDSLTNTKQKLVKPQGKDPLKIYVCGPTVYDDMHLGHVRTYLIFDVLVRYLRSLDWPVKYIQNITDIDDKIINRAHEQKISSKDFAELQLQNYLSATKKLDLTSVDKYIKASSVLPGIIKAITKLVDLDFAYATKQGVYFRVRKFKPYGKLSGQTLDKLQSGQRVELDPDKEDALDFALWKNKKHDYEPSWGSPWGEGRPGWHIECSSIIAEAFGGSVDIHGGGSDLKFPHHEAEIAQVESVCSSCSLAKIWMHTGLLTLNGSKMSKSDKNFITIEKFLAKYHADVIRFIMLSSHYRSPLNWQQSLVDQSISSLLSLKTFLAWLDQSRSDGKIDPLIENAVESFSTNFTTSLEDDFNTPKALAEIFKLVNLIFKSKKELNKSEAEKIKTVLFKEKLALLGFNFETPSLPAKIKTLIDERETARAERDFQQADKLRDDLAKQKYIIEDTANSPIIIFNDLEH